MNDANYKLTTVKVISENYSKFKLLTIDTDMTLQKLVNRAVKNYLDSDEFKKQIDESNVIKNNNKY